jgi:hypothetical protein
MGRNDDNSGFRSAEVEAFIEKFNYLRNPVVVGNVEDTEWRHWNWSAGGWGTTGAAWAPNGVRMNGQSAKIPLHVRAISHINLTDFRSLSCLADSSDE